MNNQLKILLFLQCFASPVVGRITNISPVDFFGVDTKGKAVSSYNNAQQMEAYGTICKFDPNSGKLIFADSHLPNVKKSALRWRLGCFSLLGNLVKGFSPFKDTGEDIFGNDNTSNVLVRTFDTDGSNAYCAFGTGSANGVAAATLAPAANVAARGLFKVALGDGNQDTLLAPAVDLKDFVNADGPIDRVLYVPGKGARPALLVVGVFQSGQGTYYNQDNGVVRVVNASTMASVGSLKASSGGADFKFTTKAGGGLLGMFRQSSGAGSDADFIHSMHYDQVLDRIFIGVYGDNPAVTKVRCCPYLVCRFDTNNTDLLAERLHGFTAFPADGGQNNIVSTSHSNGIAVPLIKTMNLKAGANTNSYLISNIQAVNNNQTLNLAKNLCVYATPLVSRLTTVVAPVLMPSDEDIGKAALIFNPSDIATTTFALPATSNTSADLYKAAENESGVDTSCPIPALVGGGPVPASIQPAGSPNFKDDGGTGEEAFLANITCLEVVYNTVLVGVTGTVANGAIGDPTIDDNHRIGVWASTAIVDEVGVVQGWTPWTRVLGMHVPVYGMGFDMANLRLWTMHKEPNGDYFSGCSVTSVGLGHSIEAANLNACGATGPTTLVNRLTQDLGSIKFAKSFAGYRTANLGKMSVLVAAGDKGIALAKTADTDWSTATGKGVLSSCPLRESVATLPANYVFFENPGIKGKVKAVEYSRLNDATGPVILSGFFFVGTTNGLYVLRKNADGEGLSNAGTNLTDVTAATWSFVEVTVEGSSVTNIQDLAVVSDFGTSYLLVLCNKKLVRIKIPDTFTDADKNITGANAVTLHTFADGEVGYSLQTFGSVSTLVTDNTINVPTDATLAGCGIMLSSSGIYQLRGLFSSVPLPPTGNGFECERILKTHFGDGTENRVRSVEVVPVNQWALHGQFGTISTARTVANLYVVTGDIFSGKGSEVYVVALKGKIQAPGANFTAIKSAVEGGNAYAFGLSNPANQTAAPVKIMGSGEIGAKLLNYLKIDGLPLVAASWDKNASAGISGIDQGSQGSVDVDGKVSFAMIGTPGGDASILMQLKNSEGSTVAITN